MQGNPSWSNDFSRTSYTQTAGPFDRPGIYGGIRGSEVEKAVLKGSSQIQILHTRKCAWTS